MPSTSTLPATIDEVIDRLDAVIDAAVREGSRLAYFACLYRNVTRRVRDGIRDGRFEDGPRMARLDVIFANRYLSSLETYRGGKPTCRCWTASFDAARTKQLLILQHLLLGINAHINFDLGVAAALTAPGPDLRKLRRDFDEISNLLGEMLDDVQDRIARVSPFMGLLDRIGQRTDEMIVGFTLGGSRDLAWKTAEKFAALPLTAHQKELDRLDHLVASLARPIVNPGLLVGSALRLIRLREPKDVRDVVRVFA